MAGMELYGQDYFGDRYSNDPKRQVSFLQEKQFINQYITDGTMLDVGCSTGEFVRAINWPGAVYGMEVSEVAVSEAQKVGIKFDKNLFNAKDFFDIIVFRGTIQHIETPFVYLVKSYQALKPGGYLVFLATPNANSIYYKFWNTLPFLDQPRNYYIPADHSLINSLRNMGFVFVDIEYPYWKSPYRNLVWDHINFIKRLVGMDVKFSFWRSMINLIVRRPPRGGDGTK